MAKRAADDEWVFAMIASIQEHPMIWDRYSEEYKTFSNREVAWMNVAAAVNAVAGIELPITELKKRWTTIRSAYLRPWRDVNSTSKYDRSLGFLEKCRRHRQQKSSTNPQPPPPPPIAGISSSVDNNYTMLVGQIKNETTSSSRSEDAEHFDYDYDDDEGFDYDHGGFAPAITYNATEPPATTAAPQAAATATPIATVPPPAVDRLGTPTPPPDFSTVSSSAAVGGGGKRHCPDSRNTSHDEEGGGRGSSSNDATTADGAAASADREQLQEVKVELKTAQSVNRYSFAVQNLDQQQHQSTSSTPAVFLQRPPASSSSEHAEYGSIVAKILDKLPPTRARREALVELLQWVARYQYYGDTSEAGE